MGLASELKYTSFKFESDTISRRATMRFIHVAVAVLSLLSVGQSAPVTNCESLIQPLDITGREQLLGKWMLIAETINSAQAGRIIKTYRDSSWMKIIALNESDAIDVISSSKVERFDLCITALLKMTVENNTLQPVLANMTLKSGMPGIKLLKTGCSDCLLLLPPQSTSVFGKSTGSLLLMSKRRTVTAAEMEEFKKQAECLNLPSPIVSNPEANVCPEPPIQDTENTDELRLFFNEQAFNFNMDKNISDSGLPKNFLEMVSEIISKKD